VSELIAVCCHFNPCHYKKRVINYATFRKGIERAGVHLITVEATINSEEPELSLYDNVLHFEVKHVMWYKEQLLEKGIQYAIERFKAPYVMWIDADAVIEGAEWNKVIIKSLQKHKIIQGFNIAISLHSDRTIKKYCSVETIRNGLTLGRGAPGGVWAARSDFFDTHNLYKYAIVGGGDAVFCFSMCFDVENDIEKFSQLLEIQNRSINLWSTSFKQHCLEWIQQTHIASDDVGFACQKAIFLEHGPSLPRWGPSRLEIMQKFNPYRDVRVSKNGFLEWTNLEYEGEVYDYFKNRNEDNEGLSCQNTVP